jgi:DNA polymerase-3 subunit epsilon
MVDSMALSFTAFDFETANSDRSSACAIGAVKVRGGKEVDTFSSLILPHEVVRSFASINTRIHGISAESVVGAPEWPEIYPEFRSFVGDDLVVGHNVSFDVSVLQNVCRSYDIDRPEWDTACTLHLARRFLKIPSYTLPRVADHLNLGAINHHDSLDDARASSKVFLSFAALKGVHSARALVAAAGL